MSVFVVIEDYGPVHGVFSTREKAQAFIDSLRSDAVRARLNIEEFEIDASGVENA